MSEISLRTNDGFTIVVPASLDAITTYVILEQEKWFEKEMAFLARWLRRGMNIIDVGANLGVYSLPLARLAGPDGRVFCYEPASETRRLLNLSKKKNRANNLDVIGKALSDGEGKGRLVLGTSSELNTLGGTGPGEDVDVTSLDAEDQTRNWGAIDFLKIDAEGEEEKILSGAKAFFAHQSPLVMFEVKAGDKPNDNLRNQFVSQGFGIYRLLGHAPVLVPVEIDDPVDGFELNFFAAKPDRASVLADEGLLVDAVSAWRPDDPSRVKAVAAIREQRFAPAFAQLFDENTTLDPAYRDALAGYATWRSADLSLSQRYAALQFACDTLWTLCEKESSLARLSTLARVAGELGRRSKSVHALNVLSKILKDGSGRMDEAFWPANPRFDSISPGPNVIQWFVVSVLEQFEKTASYSSMFRSSGVDLDWLSSQPFVSAEIDRRRTLLRARAGQNIQVPPRLLTGAADHLNADIWRGGLVPNTIVRR